MLSDNIVPKLCKIIFKIRKWQLYGKMFNKSMVQKPYRSKKRAPHFVFEIICRILQLQDTHQQE